MRLADILFMQDMFSDREEMEAAKRKYIHANKMKNSKSHELKALPKQKRSLYNLQKKYDSVAVVLDYPFERIVVNISI